MDLLTALEHELGRRLGFEHTDAGVVSEALAGGGHRLPSSGSDVVAVAVNSVDAAAERSESVSTMRPEATTWRGVPPASSAAQAVSLVGKPTMRGSHMISSPCNCSRISTSRGYE